MGVSSPPHANAHLLSIRKIWLKCATTSGQELCHIFKSWEICYKSLLKQKKKRYINKAYKFLTSMDATGKDWPNLSRLRLLCEQFLNVQK